MTYPVGTAAQAIAIGTFPSTPKDIAVDGLTDLLGDDLAKEEAVLDDQLNTIANRNVSVKEDFETRVPNYDGDDHDEDDYAHEITDFERNSAIVRELEQRLREVKKTREKIKNGQYGKCEGCSGDIESGRLKVVTIASLCISCAEKL